MRERKGTSLADVAKATGVTTATVSRVLNNRFEGFSVRPELKSRILQAAKDLNYRPDLMAQSLRKNQMGIVGLLGTHLPLVIPEYTLRNMVSVFEANDVKLTTCFADSIERSHDLPPWRVDAAVISGALSATDTRAVEKAGIPYVSINGWCGSNGISVQFDDADGTRQVMEHLISLGHRKIAYANVGGPWGRHPSVDVRHQNYLACLRQHGRKPVPLHDAATDTPAHDFVRTVHAAGATAILAYHHFNAVYVLQAANELGIDVPRQMSLACFNDEYPLQFLHPQISAVALPAADAGRVAAERLMEQMRTQEPKGEMFTLKETLMPRASTTRPPA